MTLMIKLQIKAQTYYVVYCAKICSTNIYLRSKFIVSITSFCATLLITILIHIYLDQGFFFFHNDPFEEIKKKAMASSNKFI